MKCKKCALNKMYGKLLNSYQYIRELKRARDNFDGSILSIASILKSIDRVIGNANDYLCEN
jgi:hypothetical protein